MEMKMKGNRLEPTGEAHLLEIIVIGKSATGFVPTCPPIT